MKKWILAIVAILGMTYFSHAQLAQKNSSFASIGYGYPSGMQLLGQFFKMAVSVDAADTNESSKFNYSGIGPIHFRYEYMLGGRIGIGLSANGELGTFKFRNTYTDIYNNVVTNVADFNMGSINALVRSNFHFLRRNEKIDLYYGASVGYSYTRVKFKETLSDYVPTAEDEQYYKEFNEYLNSVFKIFPVAFESVFGGRFALGQNAGLYFEVGYAKAFAQLGFFAKMGNTKGYSRSRWQWY
jgi:hypothetical protein